ncbi:MAG: energy-coupling factor transporter transmembrane protein EcfT [Nitrososphaerota archaeon]|jgi:energy-coupling factor transport system permease protein|nr:energy-coupling factor transporter transmembrane protein EcfT [Nitrososphaerota archaeon]
MCALGLVTAEFLGWSLFLIGAAVPIYLVFGVIGLAGFREITRFQRHSTFYYNLNAGSKLCLLVSMALSAPFENWWVGLLVPTFVIATYLSLKNGIRKFLIGLSLTVAFIWATSWGAVSDFLPSLLAGRTFRGENAWSFLYHFASVSFLNNFRVAGVFLMALILIMTSTPTEVLHVLRKVKMPNGISFSLIVGMRTVPIIFESINSIIKVQFMRGFGSLGRRSLYPVYVVFTAVLAIIPTMIFLLRGARNTAISTGTRAFGAYKGRTFLNPILFGRNDVVVILLAAFLLSISVSLSVFGL